MLNRFKKFFSLRAFVFFFILSLGGLMGIVPAQAASAIPFSIALSEVVTVTGTPRLALNVGGVTRYATYASGSGTSTLTFTYTTQAGDVDLDGITVSSPIDLNGGTITDQAGNVLSVLSVLSFTPPNTAGIKVNHPSLSMDFVNNDYILNGTHYATLPSFLTAAGGSFTRASIGTYFDSSGILQTATSGTPRFDYDPVTHVAKGILIEEARTNLFKYSSDCSNADWNKYFGLTCSANAAIAPDGTTTANLLTFNGTVNGQLTQAITVTNGSVYTFSAYVKSDGTAQTSTRLYVNTGAGIVTYAFTPTATWTRVSLTFTAVATSIAPLVLDDNAHSFYVWGLQIEQGAFPTSYIPTTTAAVTRAADSLTLPTSSWFEASQGSTIVSLDFLLPIVTNKWQGVFSLDDGTFQNSLRAWSDPSGAYWAQRQLAGAIAETSRANVFILGGGLYKVAHAYNSSGLSGVSNGTVLSPLVFTGVPSVNTLRIGACIGLGQLSGHVDRLRYYPSRVSDTQLQLLTQ